ncbi:transcription factor AP-2 [Oesophagostomum dentatum]|uniref:Transcription factor AP-2 n=1 Tax=Oesophagostomum dentatum TaxID=61180 RepID=A0A0B1SU94_OESDE|nr:transcription factor AP-2 [Oesophagostomum dentatum]
MSGEMAMNNASASASMNSRKRPLADASSMELNTPKREYYQPFHPYPYMNMMTPPPMFQSTPFHMRGDENQPPPHFMPGEFCHPTVIMSGEMAMNNASASTSMNSRKRPLTDASSMELNTPKREYYQPFHPYPYMNMMTPPPMFQSTPFHMRGDENQPPPHFMPGEFCHPMSFPPYTPFSCSPANSSMLSNSSSNDSGISGGTSSSSSCENSPSTSSESKCKDDEVLFQVPSRLNHISKNKVTLAELKRRIGAPECLNSSFLGIYLRLAKTKEVGKELRDNLAKHGISLPSGRRKGVQNTVFTCLVEEEATQLGRDMHTLVQQHYPVRPLIDMAARKSVSHPDERRRDLIGAM